MNRIALTISLSGAVGCLLAAAERDYGISRSAVLSHVPEMGCVRRVLEAIDELSEVKVMSDQAGVTEDGAPQSEFRSFRYQGVGFRAGLSIRASVGQPIVFEQDRITVNTKIPPEELEKTRRIMRLIEERLATECDMPELRNSVKEWTNK